MRRSRGAIRRIPGLRRRGRRSGVRAVDRSPPGRPDTDRDPPGALLGSGCGEAVPRLLRGSLIRADPAWTVLVDRLRPRRVASSSTRSPGTSTQVLRAWDWGARWSGSRPATIDRGARTHSSAEPSRRWPSRNGDDEEHGMTSPVRRDRLGRDDALADRDRWCARAGDHLPRHARWRRDQHARRPVPSGARTAWVSRLGDDVFGRRIEVDLRDEGHRSAMGAPRSRSCDGRHDPRHRGGLATGETDSAASALSPDDLQERPARTRRGLCWSPGSLR